MITRHVYKTDYNSLDLEALKLNCSFNLDSWHADKAFEFCLSRHLILELLKNHFNLSVSSIERDSKNRPIWPPSIVGSISHSKEAIFLALGHSNEYLSIGVDIESTARFNGESYKKFMSDEDLVHVHGLSDIELRALIFSAKESLYKLLNPLTDIYFGFDYASIVDVDLNCKSFEIKLLKSLNEDFSIYNNSSFTGRFDILNGEVLTVISIKK